MFEPKHHCAKPGCNILLPRNQLFCEKHQIKKNKRTNDKFYKTTFWIKLRQRCLNRDKYICQSCGNFGNIVDHVKPREDGGDDKLYNLELYSLVKFNLGLLSRKTSDNIPAKSLSAKKVAGPYRACRRGQAW